MAELMRSVSRSVLMGQAVDSPHTQDTSGAGPRCTSRQHGHSTHTEKRTCNLAKVHCRSLPLSILLCALEPPLVTNLNLEDVQGAVADCCCDQLVPAALIAISCTPDKALSVRGETPLQQGGACHLLQRSS